MKFLYSKTSYHLTQTYTQYPTTTTTTTTTMTTTTTSHLDLHTHTTTTTTTTMSELHTTFHNKNVTSTTTVFSQLYRSYSMIRYCYHTASVCKCVCDVIQKHTTLLLLLTQPCATMCLQFCHLTDIVWPVIRCDICRVVVNIPLATENTSVSKDISRTLSRLLTNLPGH